MPVTYEIDNKRSIIHTSCTGAVTFDEVVGHFSALARDPACPDRLDVLLDLTRLETAPTSDQLMRITEVIGQAREKVRFGACAIVAPSDLLFGFMRMFEVFAEEKFHSTMTFRGLDDAARWLAEQVTEPQKGPAR